MAASRMTGGLAEAAQPLVEAVPERRTGGVGLAERLTRAIVRKPLILTSALFVVLVSVAALAAPILPLPDPTEQSVIRRLKPPSAESVFGTDRLGRDILSRVVWGGRLSLIVGVGVVALSVLFGTAIGLA